MKSQVFYNFQVEESLNQTENCQKNMPNEEKFKKSAKAKENFSVFVKSLTVKKVDHLRFYCPHFFSQIGLKI